MDSIDSGFILYYTSLRDHPKYGMEKPFRRHDAWLWMLTEACRSQDGRGMTRVIGGKEYELVEPYGGFCHSLRFMAKAFGWSTKKVTTFLKRLENDQMIEIKSDQKVTQITICNFKVYQKRGNSKETARKQQGNSKETNYNRVTGNQGNNKELKRYSPNFEQIWTLYPSKTGKDRAKKKFKATVKTEQDFADIQKALSVYLKSQRVRDGYVMNGSTWFNQWRDWITNPISHVNGQHDEGKKKWDAWINSLE